MNQQRKRTKADAPSTKDLVNRVRKGTHMTFDQAANFLHEYGKAVRKYKKWRNHPDFPNLSEDGRKEYTREERMLAVSEYWRGYRNALEEAIATMHGYDVRDRIRKEYDHEQ